MKEKIKISFLSDVKERELLYALRDELSKKGFFAIIEESDREKYMVPGAPTGSVGPDLVKEVFLSLAYISFTISSTLLLQGFFNEMGSDIYKKIKEILVKVIKRNKKTETKSPKVVIEIIKKQPETIDNQLWLFFLDSVENEKIIEALKKIKEATLNNATIFNSEYSKKVWKFGFIFNNKEDKWQILDIQEFPSWMLGERNNNHVKKLESVSIINKKTKIKALTVDELLAQVTALQGQLRALDSKPQSSRKNK